MSQDKRIINVLVAGHAQHGKSSLIEAICGIFPDNLNFELSHGTTVSLKVIQFEVKSKNIIINFLDSPGHADFKGSIALGLEFADLLLLVVSGKEGFQSRTYWLYEKAIEKKVPILIVATKMDLKEASTSIIEKDLEKLNLEKSMPILPTSSRKMIGIQNVIEHIAIKVKRRDQIDALPSFIILGYVNKKGMGELLTIGILAGKLTNGWITEKIKVRHLFSMTGKPLEEAKEGEIVQAALNVQLNLDLGTKFINGKFLPPSINNLLAEIQPRKEFYININDPTKFKIALDILSDLKKIIPSFSYYYDRKTISVQVLGDLQFEFIKESLQDLIEFKVLGSKIKGIITIDSNSIGKHGTATVRIAPRFKNSLTVIRYNPSKGILEPKLHDILGASAAKKAFNLDGLHVDIYSGKNEDDVAQAIANAIERSKIIKILPFQDIIVKINNSTDLFPLLEKYNAEILHQTTDNNFFVQVKNQVFEQFFNSLMKISKGQAEIKLFRFDQEDLVLSVDPGTRHFGFCLIEKGELPALWHVNLKVKINDARSKKIAKIRLKRELDIFLGTQKDFITKIFIGNGPGSELIIDMFNEYFDINNDNKNDLDKGLGTSLNNKSKKDKFTRFKKPDIYIVNEFKTTKEAIFHLRKGKIISEVEARGFLDHAIAALLIARKGIKGEVIKIKKKPLKQLQEYIVENYSGTFSFSSIHNIRDINDLKTGMYLRVKDASKLDSNLKEGDIISFIGFGSNFHSMHGINLNGNRIIVKFQNNVSLKKDFFKIFAPVKERFK